MSEPENMKWVYAHRKQGPLEQVLKEFKQAAALLDAQPHSTNVSENSDGFMCQADFSTTEDADCFVEVLNQSDKYVMIFQC